MRYVAISACHSYVNIASIALYCVTIEFILSAYSITCDANRTLTGQSIALYGIVYYVSMLYSRQIQPVCIWSALYHGKVLQTFSKCNLSNIAHKSAHVFKMVFPLQKPPQGASKFFRILRKIRTKFRFKAVLKMPVRKVH